MLHGMRENPIRTLRGGMTQKVAAKQLGITSQIIVSAEAGLFNAIPSSFYALLGSERTVEDELSLDLNYTAWVEEKRRDNAWVFTTERPTPYMEWKTWKKRISPTHRGFCKLLVINPQILTRFERRHWHKGLVKTALLDVGLTRTEIAGLGV